MVKELIVSRIVTDVKNLLRKSLVKFADETHSELNEVRLEIWPADERGNPEFMLYQPYTEIEKRVPFKDLVSATDKIKYQIMGFDVVKRCPEYVRDFIIRACRDNDVHLNKSRFYIKADEDEIAVAAMIIGTLAVKVPLEYIMKKE
jgi:hypothetical protein